MNIETMGQWLIAAPEMRKACKKSLQFCKSMAGLIDTLPDGPLKRIAAYDTEAMARELKTVLDSVRNDP